MRMGGIIGWMLLMKTMRLVVECRITTIEILRTIHDVPMVRKIGHFRT
jgi:hypothetical protein